MCPVDEDLHEEPHADGRGALIRRSAVKGKELATGLGIDRPRHEVTTFERPKQHGQRWDKVGGIMEGPRPIVGSSFQCAPQ